MVIDTTPIKGAKMFGVIPKHLEEAVKQFDKNSRLSMMSFNSLSQYKMFMVENKGFECNLMSSEKKEDGKFSGVENYDKFLELLDSGDKAVIKQIKEQTKTQVTNLKKQYKDVFQGYKFDVTGQFFDVGLVLSGVPESWLNPIEEPEEELRVEISLNGSFNAGTDKKTVIAGASRVLAMVHILEEHNVLVKVNIVSLNDRYTKSRASMVMEVVAKDYDEPINYHKMSALVSPTFHRRGAFKAMELVSENGMGAGYGRPLRNVTGLTDLFNDRSVTSLEKRLFKGEKK